MGGFGSAVAVVVFIVIVIIGRSPGTAFRYALVRLRHRIRVALSCISCSDSFCLARSLGFVRSSVQVYVEEGALDSDTRQTFPTRSR